MNAYKCRWGLLLLLTLPLQGCQTDEKDQPASTEADTEIVGTSNIETEVPIRTVRSNSPRDRIISPRDMKSIDQLTESGGTTATSAIIGPREINSYKRQIEVAVQSVMNSPNSDSKAQAVAEARAQDLEAELELAKSVESNSEAELARERIRRGIEELLKITTQPPEQK